MTSHTDLRQQLLELAHDLGNHRQMAIFGEGNVSGRVTTQRFLVKASGTRLSVLRPEHLVEVRAGPLLAAMQEGSALSDADIDALLMEARTDPEALKPSVETLFHAWLLQLPLVAFIGHTHATAVNQILCSPAAEVFAARRVIPEQVVYCGRESVLVPYADPGQRLAQEIAARVEAFMERMGEVPKTILLKNHGIVALGARHTEVMAAMAMAEKAARIFIGAAALGGPVFMEKHQVDHIDGRTDIRHHRHVSHIHP